MMQSTGTIRGAYVRNFGSGSGCNFLGFGGAFEWLLFREISRN